MWYIDSGHLVYISYKHYVAMEIAGSILHDGT